MRLSVRVTPRRAAAVLAGAIALGLLVAWSGVISIGASSGHWRITSWALHWAMQNSTRTYALFEPAPPDDIDSAANIRRAAGHFETGCAFCHGSPLNPAPGLSAHMTPMPPGLQGSPATWTPRELARIVRHGVKYTGMPAWIAPQRDDEIWAMVAFLRALPALSPQDYRRLAGLTPSTAPASEDRVLAGCARCHGVDGGSDGGAFPVLGGQTEAYLQASLADFASGTRPSGIMQLAVDGLSAQDLARMARHYAAQRGLQQEPPAPTGGLGGRIARQGLPEADVPACESCHGASPRHNSAYPRLTGQDATHLRTQLQLFRDGRRGVTGQARIMQRIAERLPPEAVAAIAEFYSGVGGKPPR